MPCFTDLPNELYFQILQHLPPPDRGNFYCVNKSLYTLTAIHRIRHQSLKWRFSTSLNTDQPGSTAKLIKSILDDPQIALYIQRYTIDGYRFAWALDSKVLEPKLVKYTPSDMAQLELALQDCEYNGGRESWIKNFRMGDETVLISLALTLFPNLTSVHIRYTGFYSAALTRIIRRIAHARCPGGPLTNLISVTITLHDDLSCDDIPYDDNPASEHDFLDFLFIEPKLVEAFAALPSVKIINAEAVVDYSEQSVDFVPVIGSNVTDMNFLHGDISPHRLKLLLQSFEHLQSFTYSPACFSRAGHDFDASSIITTLLACAQDSLRELRIRPGPATKEYMGSLHGFRCLEYVDTEATLLFGDDSTLTHTFQNSLPPSIQEVKLDANDSSGYDLRLRLISLVESREILPSLNRIELRDDGIYRSQSEAVWLRDTCATVNISLRFVEYDDVPLPTLTPHSCPYAERQTKKALTQRGVL